MLFLISSLNACGQTNSGQRAEIKAQIAAVQAAPALPGDCKEQERSGVKTGDKLDVALLKTDAALSRANARVTRCADWYINTRGAVDETN